MKIHPSSHPAIHHLYHLKLLHTGFVFFMRLIHVSIYFLLTIILPKAGFPTPFFSYLNPFNLNYTSQHNTTIANQVIVCLTNPPCILGLFFPLTHPPVYNGIYSSGSWRSWSQPQLTLCERWGAPRMKSSITGLTQK